MADQGPINKEQEARLWNSMTGFEDYTAEGIAGHNKIEKYEGKLEELSKEELIAGIKGLKELSANLLHRLKAESARHCGKIRALRDIEDIIKKLDIKILE